MATYGFRVKFSLPNEQAIDSKDLQVEMVMPTSNTLLTLGTTHKLEQAKYAREWFIRGEKLLSEADAWSYCHRVKRALLLSSVFLKMGISIGDDKTDSRFRGDIRKKELPVTDGLHLVPVGLLIYQDDRKNFVFATGGHVTISWPIETFIEQFKRAYELSIDINEKYLLALELYSESRFESTLRIRFLMLIIAVESLIVKKEQSDDVIKFLDELKRDVKSRFVGSKKDRDIISNGLGKLKEVGIAQATRDFIKEFLGEQHMKFFSECYAERSNLVHNGQISKDYDLGSVVFLLDEMVARLLKKVIIGEEG